KWTIGGTDAEVQVWIHSDGSITVIPGVSGVGQGTDTAVAMVVAEELQVPWDRVRVAPQEEWPTELNLSAGSSRGATHFANAALLAARDARRKLLELVSGTLNVPAGEVELREGRIFYPGGPQDGMQLGEVMVIGGGVRGLGMVVGEGHFKGREATWYDPETGHTDRICAELKFWATGAVVTVDTETGVVQVDKLVGCHDVGFAINPLLVEGQIDGGMIMGLGPALSEQAVFDNGVITNPNFMEYLVPTADMVPTEVEAIILETGGGIGPKGAQGIGEPPLVAVAPAIGNAVFDAVGVRIYDLPITPEKVLEALQAQRSQGSG
ncbi:MAG: xanthine dehydrogenase family protein molybdopterin-binding subunit, partial [Dehalococcoidia bacterium]